MVLLMVATLSRGVTFGRLLRPHPRVLGTSVCASARCFLAGPSSGRSRAAVVATSSSSSSSRTTVLHIFLLYPIQLIALITNILLSVAVRGTIYECSRAGNHLPLMPGIGYHNLLFVLSR